MMKPDNAGAGATDYMHLFGLVALGYMWARIAEAAIAKLPKANGSAPRYSAKLATARFFMERMLPETALAAGEDPGRGGECDGVAGRGFLKSSGETFTAVIPGRGRKAANPESMRPVVRLWRKSETTNAGIMDSGFARCRSRPGMTD